MTLSSEPPEPLSSKKLNGDVDLDEPAGLHPTNSNKSHFLRYVSLVVLVVQMVSLVLLIRFVKKRPGTQFLNTVLVLFSEVVKLIASLLLFTVSSGSISKTLIALHYHFLIDFKDTLKVMIPAFIYTVQNLLLFVALSHLDSATYLVTYQLKILTTAIFTVTILKRRLAALQWLALFVLLVGVVLVQYDSDKNPSNLQTQHNLSSTVRPPLRSSSCVVKSVSGDRTQWIGVLAVLIAAFMSGFAGIYFEKILKSSNVSIWMRNVQLSAFSIPLAALMVGVKDRDCVVENGLLAGFDAFVWIAVFLQALGGLVVAVVIKYADNIMKAFAASISIVVGAAVAKICFNEEPKEYTYVGIPFVIGAVVLYSVQFNWFSWKKTKSEDK